MIAWLAPALLVSLASCGTPKRIEIAKPPAERLQCADSPAVPDEPVTDAKVADYLVALHGAHGDCKNAVAWLSDWFSALPD